MPRYLSDSLLLMSRRERQTFGLFVVSRVLLHAFDVLGLVVVGVLASLAISGDTSLQDFEFLRFLRGWTTRDVFLLLTAVVGALFLSKTLFAVWTIRAQLNFLGKLEAGRSAELTDFLFGPNLSKNQSYSRGEIQWLIQTSVGQAFATVPHAWATLITETSLLVAIFVTFLFVDGLAALSILLFLVVTALIFQFVVGNRASKIGKELAQVLRAVNNRLLDVTAAFREIEVFGKRASFLSAIKDPRRQIAMLKADQRFVLTIPRYIVEMALILGFVGFAAVAVLLGDANENLPVAAVFLTGGVRLAAALVPVQNAVNSLKSAGPQAQRSQELLRLARQSESVAPEGFHSPPSFRRAPTAPIGLSLENLHFSYEGSHMNVISGLSFELEPGSMNALVGPSGAGKSTLADICMGLLTPDGGSATTTDGIPIHDLVKMNPGVVGYVPQNPGLIGGNLANNIALSHQLDSRDLYRVEQVVELAGLGTYVRELKNGIFTDLGQQSHSLSGGQRQRLGLARALFSDPGLLVLDEATSALEPQLQTSLNDLLNRMKKQTTVLSISHQIARLADYQQIIVLHRGKVVNLGTFDELLESSSFVQDAMERVRNRSDGSRSQE